MPDEASRSLIERKLTLLVSYLEELSSLVGDGSGGLPGNTERRAIERLVQLLVEVATDVNGIIAASKGIRPPATARESFVAVRDAGVLDSRLAERFIASYVGLRNRIVHDYDTLDVGLTVRAAARLLQDAAEYGREVRRYLGAPGTEVKNGETDPPARRS